MGLTFKVIFCTAQRINWQVFRAFLRELSARSRSDELAVRYNTHHLTDNSSNAGTNSRSHDVNYAFGLHFEWRMVTTLTCRAAAVVRWVWSQLAASNGVKTRRTETLVYKKLFISQQQTIAIYKWSFNDLWLSWHEMETANLIMISFLHERHKRVGDHAGACWLVRKQKRRFLIRKWSENWIVNTTRHHNKSDLLRRSDCRCFSLNSAISHITMRPWTFEQDSLRALQRCFKMRIWLERLFNNGPNWPYWCVVSDAFKAQRALELSNRSFHLFSELLPGEVIHRSRATFTFNDTRCSRFTRIWLAAAAKFSLLCQKENLIKLNKLASNQNREEKKYKWNFRQRL